MALELTPLDEATLSPGVLRAVGSATPAPLREMAARGLAPLAPPELLLALYQLAAPWSEADRVAEMARASLDKMPEKLIAGALSSATEPRVIDFVVRRRQGAELARAALLNRTSADETVAWLASVLDGAELELIARNEERLLRHPPIIAALYLNRKTPLSLSVRAVELAVRNGIAVEGIPEFEAVRDSLMNLEATVSSGDDAAFEAALGPAAEAEPALDAGELAAEGAENEGEEPPLHPEEQKRAVPIAKLSMIAKIRLATLGDSFARGILIRDSNRVIQMAAIHSPRVNDQEVVRYAQHRGLSEDVIRYITQQRHFVRLYAVKIGLVNNPKCPIGAAIGLLAHLQARDLRNVGRSKSVPATLARAARELQQKRQQQ